MPPLCLLEQCQRMLAKTENNIKMSKFQLEITHHTQHQEDLKLSANRQLIKANNEMTEILELSDDEFDAIMIKSFGKPL